MKLDLGMRRLKESFDSLLITSESELQDYVKDKKWKAVSGIADHGCLLALSNAMIDIRCNNDINVAKDYLLRALNLAKTLRHAPPEFVVSGSYKIPIHCCLLSGDIETAKQLAEQALSENVKIMGGSYDDAYTQVLSAFILNNTSIYKEKVLAFKKIKSIYWWEKQDIYFKLYVAVLDNNEESFNALLLEAIELFKERRTDKKFDDMQGEYGGLRHNDFTIDFMSVAIAIIAKSKGLKTTLNNVYFPYELIK